jgi:hypothetical protein
VEPLRIRVQTDRYEDLPVRATLRSSGHEHWALRCRRNALCRRARDRIEEPALASADDDEIGAKVTDLLSYGGNRAAHDHMRAHRQPLRSDLFRNACESISRECVSSLSAEEARKRTWSGVNDVEMGVVRPRDIDRATQSAMSENRRIEADDDRFATLVSTMTTSASRRPVRPR